MNGLTQKRPLRQNEFGKRVCKIVLTGGPCAGKTTAMKETAEKIRDEYGHKWQVFTVSETSSFLYTGRVQRSHLNEYQVNQWQEDVLATILQLESVYDNIAEREFNRDTMIICDRGGMDPKAYTDGEELWEEILQRLGINEDHLYDRYDAVIQMHTAPKEFYSTTNNPYRRENYEEATVVNAKYQLLWQNHPSYFIVDNYDARDAQDGWVGKSSNVYEIIRQYLDM